MGASWPPATVKGCWSEFIHEEVGEARTHTHTEPTSRHLQRKHPSAGRSCCLVISHLLLFAQPSPQLGHPMGVHDSTPALEPEAQASVHARKVVLRTVLGTTGQI